MKSNTYYRTLSHGIGLCLGLSWLSSPLPQSAVNTWLSVVDNFHESGMHRIAHKLDDAVCNAVEKYGVAA